MRNAYVSIRISTGQRCMRRTATEGSRERCKRATTRLAGKNHRDDQPEQTADSTAAAPPLRQHARRIEVGSRRMVSQASVQEGCSRAVEEILGAPPA